MPATKQAMAAGATRSTVTTTIRPRIGCAPLTSRPASGSICRSTPAKSGALTMRWPRCFSCSPAKAPEVVRLSNCPEDRQRQHGLREEADGEGNRPEHRQAERVDDEMRDAGPEIDG